MLLKLRIQKFLPETLIFIAFCIIQLLHINIDFWNDEIYTLKHFTFVPFSQITSDYHVPNNHIFFNLINKTYLQLININSLHILLDSPYKLRIVPLIYSALTVYYSYLIGRKFLSRNIALLTAGILITSIPYFNFSLQIRGYGFSTLILVMLTYYILIYIKSIQKKYLPVIILLSAILIYTIPSNIYPVFSLSIICSIYFLIFIIKNKKNLTVNVVLSNLYFHLIVCFIIGLLLSLVFYYPVFNDVFFNKYVKPGPQFNLLNLKFYTSNIFYGIVSNRWILLAASCLGFFFGFKKLKKWSIPILLFLAIGTIPILIVFIRGDIAPLRTFVVSTPFFALLFAIGVSELLSLISKYNSLVSNTILAGIFIYCFVIFRHQISKIDEQIMNDIEYGGRSQNLYYQYYSSHYQPLNDVMNFKKIFDSNKLPVLIDGCEPHGISNYLEKFNIPFLTTHNNPNTLDSLMHINDSVYILTNHPYKYDDNGDYYTKRLNQNLSYHNVLLFTNSNLIYSQINSRIDSFKVKYKDSISFVINIHENSFISDTSLENYYITDSNKNNYGYLLEFISKKPYIGYVESKNTNTENIQYIIKDNFKTIVNDSSTTGINFYIGKNSSNNNSGFKELYFNNYEDITESKHNHLDSTNSYSGVYSEKLNEIHDFSSSFSFFTNEKKQKTILKVSFMGKFNEDTEALVVIDIYRDENQIFWSGNNISDFYNPNYNWQKVISIFNVDDELQKNDEIKIYIWNPKKEVLWIDDLKIALKESKLN